MSAHFQVSKGLLDEPHALPRPHGATYTNLYTASAGVGKFCHHPNLVVFRDRLLCMWSNGLDGEDLAGQRVLYSHSSDGEGWSAPVVLADDGLTGICVAAGWHVSSDGKTLVGFFTVDGPSGNFDAHTGLHAITSADGDAWGPASFVTRGFFIEGPRPLPSGHLLLCGEAVGPERQGVAGKRMRVLLSSASDNDALGPWEEVDIPLDDYHRDVFGYCEAAPLVVRPAQTNGSGRSDDNQLILAFRSNTGALLASSNSSWGSAAWSTPTATGFPDNESRFHSSNLPDGTPLLINNPMPRLGPTLYDRSVLTLATSSDGGMTFDRAWCVQRGPDELKFEGRFKEPGPQYPHALTWRGSLFVAYSLSKEDVEVVRIPLAALGSRGGRL